MKTIKHTVKDPNGIHARPAGILVNTAKKFKSDIKLTSGGNSQDCKRIFSVMGMSIKAGDEFSIEIAGTDEEKAEQELLKALEESGI